MTENEKKRAVIRVQEAGIQVRKALRRLRHPRLRPEDDGKGQNQWFLEKNLWALVASYPRA